MSLKPGTRIGCYEVTAPLGAGGMGEVYRATDTKLKREVAIKVLPQSLAADPERLARFQREAEVLASLSHPNIAHIHGLEDGEGTKALVMELIEGEDLSQRIARRPLRLDEALAVARQIAAALEAAHERGIIHRDLKPANVKVKADGAVKVLDFGLAKAVERTGEMSPSASMSPTITTPGMTLAGVILGTAAYMSPEQARGMAVDTRTDIWAFGCVLYEMVVGRAAFAGETVADTFAAILEREPDWSAVPASTPQAIVQLLHRCLEKDQRQRLRDVGDARLELTHAIDARRDQRHGPVEPARRRTRWPLAVGALAGVAAVGILVIALRGRDTVPPPRANEPPQQLTDFDDSAVMPSLSHDGRMLTFIRGTDFGRTAPSQGQVYVKLLPNGDPVQLTRGQGGGYPTFSPDDSQIVFTLGSGFKWDSWIVPVLGGDPQPYLPNASGLIWLDSEHLVYSSIKSGTYMGIVTSNPSRTETKEIYYPVKESGMAHRSAASPDGRSLLVIEMDRGLWLPCRLMPLDGSSAGAPVGPPRGQCTSAAWSPDSRWMYFSSNAGGAFHIWRQKYPDGTPEQITFGPTEQEGTAITPDGQYLITAMGLYRATVWLHDAAGEQQLTDSGYAIKPEMDPSGSHLYYLMRTSGSQGQASGELWAMDMNTRSRQRFFPGLVMTHFALSQDGRRIVFTSSGATNGDGIWMADLDRRTPPRQLTHGNEPRAFFGAPGEIVFMRDNGLLYRMREDGSGIEATSQDPIVYLMSVSPDGRWAAVILPAGPGGGTSEEFRSLRGQPSFPVCNQSCGLGPAAVRYTLPFNWSLDGKWLFVDQRVFGGADHTTVVLPYRSDVPLERLWPRGLTSPENVRANPGARILEENEWAFPGSDAASYLSWRPSFQSNLYRIRIPE